MSITLGTCLSYCNGKRDIAGIAMWKLGKPYADGKETGARRFPAVCPMWNSTPPWQAEEKERPTGTVQHNTGILIMTVMDAFYMCGKIE